MTFAGNVAVLSHVAPPSPSGQSRVLEMLLNGPKAGEVVFLSDDANPLCWQGGADGSPDKIRLIPERHYLFPWPEWPGLRHINKIMGITPAIRRRARELVRALRPLGPRALVACTGSVINPAAACLAAKELGIPFIVYLFDDHLYQWPPGLYREFVRLWEGPVMRRAAALIAPNEFLAGEYFKRHGIKPHLVRNPHPLGAASGRKLPWPAEPDRIKVVYTGAIYHAHTDALQNLAEALKRLPLAAELHIYSEMPERLLRENKISGPVFHHGHIPWPQAIKEQRRADILFLPLAFDSPIPQAIRTSAPGKLAEYLASGRPVLAHAPAHSYVADFFRRKGCGLVADRPNADSLARALETLAGDENLRDQLVAKAAEAAREFSQDTAREAFWSVIDQV